MTVSDAAISDALLVSTRDGTYPESEEVLTTDLSASALRPSLQLISEAKQQIEVRGALQLLNEAPFNHGYYRRTFEASVKIAHPMSMNGLRRPAISKKIFSTLKSLRGRS